MLKTILLKQFSVFLITFSPSFYGVLHSVANILIAIVFLASAYFLIIYYKKIKDATFKIFFILLIFFIFLCVLGHLIEVFEFWFPTLILETILYLIKSIVAILVLCVFLTYSRHISNFLFSKNSVNRVKLKILELQKFNQELKESENKFKKLVENYPDSVALIGKDLTYKFVNAFSLKIRENVFFDCVNKSIFDIMESEMDISRNQIFVKYVQETFKTKQTQTFEFDFMLDSGELAILSFKMFPLDYDKKGNVENIMSICKDVTIQKRNENLLNKQIIELSNANRLIAESENKFKKLVENNPDMISLVDKNLRYNYISNAGLSLKESLFSNYKNKSIFELAVSKEDKTRSKIFEKYVLLAFETKQMQTFEYDLILDNLQKVFLSFKIFPLDFDTQGNVENVMSICKNITQQKENEALINQKLSELKTTNLKLKQKQGSLQDFAYIVSHNLRSPIANLSALLDFIKDEKDAILKDIMLEKVNEAFANLTQTVADLSEVVEIKSNEAIERQFLNFEQILKDQMLSLETQINESDAAVEYDFSLCENIKYPKIYLCSIILNLLTNAIKYRTNNRKPFIKFETKLSEKNTIILTCTDNGLGIDLEKHGSKIFGLNKTFHHHPDARGVGLFITKNQIESLGGTISVQSEVNNGSVFCINF